MDKITKLSDAIRLGATFRPQCRDAYFSKGASCALGAAVEAIESNYQGAPDWLLSERFPVLTDANVTSPASGHFGRLWETIVGLNDYHEWTRERIADWLASIGY